MKRSGTFSTKQENYDAYRLLLMRNCLSSLVAVANGKCKDTTDIGGNNRETEAEVQQSSRRNSAATEMSTCTLKPAFRPITGKRCENNFINEDRISSTPDVITKQLSLNVRKASFSLSMKSANFGVNSIENEEFERIERLKNAENLLRLCHIKNGRYLLICDETQLPALSFSIFPRHREDLIRSFSQSDDPNRSGILSYDCTTIKPINYKRTKELSFRNLLLTDVNNTSSEEDSPLPVWKHHRDDDGASSNSFPSSLSRSHTLFRDKITGAMDDMPILLRHSHVSTSSTNSVEYDPNLINNFDSDCGARKTVMKFNGYISSILHYQSDYEMKRLLNNAFRIRFPQVQVSFSKINSIKKELHKIAVACNLEDCTTALAYVFYEKVLLKGLVCKTNRKLVAGAALLIAAKITDFGSVCTLDVVNYLESSLRVNRKELLHYEIPLCAALSFDLKVPEWQVLPHYQRIALTIL